jgi:hypothetical protein
VATECSGRELRWKGPGERETVVDFEGGALSTDGGVLLLQGVDRRLGLLDRFAHCFLDHRRPERVKHTVAELVRQRVFLLALGYEDLVDHDGLRSDPLLAHVVGKKASRSSNSHASMAGSCTLSRLERTHRETASTDRYARVALDHGAVDRLLVEVFLESFRRAPRRIILDLDATDSPLHGTQEGRFFHGYYGGYCYLPLYIFCGEHLLCARLRTADIDASKGSVEELDRIVRQIRHRWPTVQVIVRADSGFCREELLKWCEANSIDYVIGIAKNLRLERRVARALKGAEQECEKSKKAVRRFQDFLYCTRKTWSRKRRVVAKAEWLPGRANPRFVVTSLEGPGWTCERVYEDLYCARGDMENRIKEQQLHLFADRMSSHMIHANQVRLYFSSIAYLLLHGLRHLGLQETAMAKAQCQTLRLRLLKVAAQIKVTARRIWVRLAHGYPWQDLWRTAFERLIASR